MSDPTGTTIRSEQAQASVLLARSQVYLFLTRAFGYPEEPLEGLHQEACTALEALAFVSPATSQALNPPDLERLRALYRATFTHTTPAEFPPYETQYGEGHIFRQSQALGELEALYRAFGVQAAAGERLDHISIELEFMYFLCYKEAFALLSDNPEGVQRCREGQKLFLEEHLGGWAPHFLERLSRQDNGFYAHLAALTGAWLAQEASTVGAQLSPLGEEARQAAQRLEQFFDRMNQMAAVCEEEV